MLSRVSASRLSNPFALKAVSLAELFAWIQALRRPEIRQSQAAVHTRGATSRLEAVLPVQGAALGVRNSEDEESLLSLQENEPEGEPTERSASDEPLAVTKHNRVASRSARDGIDGGGHFGVEAVGRLGAAVEVPRFLVVVLVARLRVELD